MDFTEALTILRNRASELSPHNQEFAASLIRWVDRGKASPSQRDWIVRLADRIVNKPAPVERVKVSVGSLQNLVEMFAYATKHVNEPHIRLALADTTCSPPEVVDVIALDIAAPHHKVPGSINVKSDDGWYGRILRDGNFEISPKYDETSMVSVVALLQRFCDDPVNTATEYGRLTGRCCFCQHKLKDERSTEMGYGPVCADNYGLDWGSKKFSFAAMPVQPPAPEVKSRRSKRNIKIGG